MKKVLFSSLFLLLVAVAAGWIYLRRFEFATLYHPSAEISATIERVSAMIDAIRAVP